MTVASTEGRTQTQIALVDLVDRLLGSGVVLVGDLVISLAGIDLVQIRLHALIASVRAEMAQPSPAAQPSQPDQPTQPNQPLEGDLR